MTDFLLARAVALKFHQGQMYGKEPYMYHLDMVADRCKKENDDRLAVIAILHDILEDTPCTLGTLYALFDKDIVNAVGALSKLIPGEPYEVYIQVVRGNPLALKVKMYDSLCNLEESMLRGDKKRILKYSKQIQLLAE